MGQSIDTYNEQKIIETLKKLPPQQLEEVIHFIELMVERGHKKMTLCKTDEVKFSILELRGRGKGEHLVERLLHSRREDNALDE
jgi:hypothetical protein